MVVSNTGLFGFEGGLGGYSACGAGGTKGQERKGKERKGTERNGRERQERQRMRGTAKSAIVKVAISLIRCLDSLIFACCERKEGKRGERELGREVGGFTKQKKKITK